MSQATPQPGDRGRVTVSLTEDRARIDEIEQEIVGSIEREGYPKASAFAVRLAFEEAVINAFKHGHKDLPDDTEITVEYEIGPDRVHLVVHDQGPGFRPEEIPDPTLEENLEAVSGRGIMLIKAYMTEVVHTDDGRRLEMRYDRPEDD